MRRKREAGSATRSRPRPPTPARSRQAVAAEDLATWRQVRSQEGHRASSYALGPYFSTSIHDDPKHLLFTLARYKFAARMLGEAKDLEVLEVGCSEGWGTLLLAQAARRVVGVDFDADAIAWAKRYETDRMSFRHEDFRRSRLGLFDAVVSIDVIEHVSATTERAFVGNISRHLRPTGFCVIGTPNATSSSHANDLSRTGHVNLFDAARLKQLVGRFFHNVFSFGMNDEVLHTGYSPMCHYLFVIGCNKKS